MFYESEKDILYIKFKYINYRYIRPKVPGERDEQIDDDIVYRYSHDELIGITINNASKKELVK